MDNRIRKVQFLFQKSYVNWNKFSFFIIDFEIRFLYLLILFLKDNKNILVISLISSKYWKYCNALSIDIFWKNLKKTLFKFQKVCFRIRCGWCFMVNMETERFMFPQSIFCICLNESIIGKYVLSIDIPISWLVSSEITCVGYIFLTNGIILKHCIIYAALKTQKCYAWSRIIYLNFIKNRFQLMSDRLEKIAIYAVLYSIS